MTIILLLSQGYCILYLVKVLLFQYEFACQCIKHSNTDPSNLNLLEPVVGAGVGTMAPGTGAGAGIGIYTVTSSLIFMTKYIPLGIQC